MFLNHDVSFAHHFITLAHCIFGVKMILYIASFKKGFGIDMALCYKKLWKLLIDRDMTRAALREATGIAPATMSKMSRCESVGAGILDRICEAMNCDVGDIVEYVPDAKSKRKAENER